MLFYILNKNILKNVINEHFLTYFLPYYDPKLNTLSNFYKKKENNLNYFKKKFNYNEILFCIDDINKNFISKFISKYVSTNNINNIKIIIDNNNLKKLNDLVENKINYLITDYSTIMYMNNILRKNIEKIKLVTNLYRLYIYFFTKKKYKVFSINNIPPEFIIGIIEYPNSFNLYFFKIMKDLGYNTKTDFKIKTYKNIYTLLEGFSNSEVNMIIFNEVFPNKIINNYLNINTFEDIILLPFDIDNQDLFLKKNRNINIDFIDLNKLGVSYLPKNFGGYTFNYYKPDFKICFNEKIIVTNIKTDLKLIYDFIKFYYENYKFINNYIVDDEGYKLYQTNIAYSTFILDFHKGVLEFLNDKGYISNIENPNCKYLVGTMECNNKNLANNNLFFK